MARDVAWTGGAALAAGLLLGMMVQRLTRDGSRRPADRSGTGPAGADPRTPAPERDGTVDADVLERYRLAAAV